MLQKPKLPILYRSNFNKLSPLDSEFMRNKDRVIRFHKDNHPETSAENHLLSKLQCF